MNEKKRERDEKYQEYLGNHVCYFLKANSHIIFSFEELQQKIVSEIPKYDLL